MYGDDMELTTNTPASFRLNSGGRAVGIVSGNYDEVGTEHETVMIEDVVIFDDFGDAQRRLPAFDVLVLSHDDTDEWLVDEYLSLQVARAQDRADVADREAREAAADLRRWYRLADA